MATLAGQPDRSSAMLPASLSTPAALQSDATRSSAAAPYAQHARPRHSLAIVTSHPIQYNAPWFRHLAARSDLLVRVFYLWDGGIVARFDPGFQQTIQWDIPLLS